MLEPVGQAAWGSLHANLRCAQLQQQPVSLAFFVALNSLTLFLLLLLNIFAVRPHYISS